MWPFSLESIHPVIVHFPIALLLTAVMLDLVAMIGAWPTLHRAALWNLALGAVAAGLAVWTGLEAEEAAKGPDAIYTIIGLHEKLGISTLVLSAVLLGWRLIKLDRLTRRARLLTLPLMLAMVGTVTFGAYLGGRLFYEFGVGSRLGLSQAGSMNVSPDSDDHR